jgi:DNA polymerase-3 subunit gamma/tau
VASFTNGHITYQSVIDNLNVLDYEYYFRLTEHILANNVRQALMTLNEIISKGFDGQNIITGLASHFRDLLVCKDEVTLVLFEVGASIRERYKETAGRCPEQLLYKAIETANQCDLNYRISRNKRLLLELTLIQLCQLTQTPPGDNKKKLLIEPLDSSGGQQPQHRPSTVQQAVEPPRKMTAPLISTSLKKMGKEAEMKADEPLPVAAGKEQLDAFGIEDLIKYWDEYEQQLEGNAYLKSIMVNCKPVLQENYAFEVSVHNPGQQDELLNDSVKLLPFLRLRLKNSRIQMRIRISETNEKKLAYTSSEKYEYLSGINPLLHRLKDEFNLMLD